MKNISVSIIDYGLGNLFNIQRAFDAIGINSIISSNPKEIKESSHLLLPGVGAFEEGMENLKKQSLVETILEFSDSGKPILGICLGMQLLMSQSFEGGEHKGLDLIEGKVLPLEKTPEIKIPNIGWTTLMKNQEKEKSGSLLENLPEDPYMYFLHSYQVQVNDSNHILSKTIYGDNEFCSSVQKDNIYGCQYHPELSAVNGLQILRNFVNI